MSEQLSDVTVEWFTRQFKEKFETDYSIVLCRPECQLAQQTSLTPSSIKVHWYLTLPNASCQHVTFCTVNFLICSGSQKNLRVSVSETAFGCIWRGYKTLQITYVFVHQGESVIASAIVWTSSSLIGLGGGAGDVLPVPPRFPCLCVKGDNQ